MLTLMFVTACVISGCGDKGGHRSVDVLAVGQAETFFEELPYQYEFSRVGVPGDGEGALTGRAFGPRKTVLNFGLWLAEAPGLIPVPHAGISGARVYPDAGFAFTSDSNVRRVIGGLTRLKTYEQYRVARHMEFAMTDKLCVAVTNDRCPVCILRDSSDRTRAPPRRCVVLKDGRVPTAPQLSAAPVG